MFELLEIKKEVTMSSREIAELVESRHDDVKRSIDRLVSKGIIQSPPLADFKNINNVSGKEYLVCKRDSYIMVAQLSPAFTARLVDRWQELEAKNQFNIPTTLSGALRLAAAQAEMLELQTQIIEQQKPAVEFVDRYVDYTGSKGFRDVCKLLKVKEHEFREFLIDKKIMYRLDGKLTPYGNHLDVGRFEVKAGIGENKHAYNQAKFTPKGIQWIAGLLMIQQLEV